MNKPAHYGFAALFGLSAVSTAIHANDFAPMLETFNGWKARALHTNGATIPNTSGALNPSTAGDYAPVGILDGLGAYELDSKTVRVFANHELLNFRGNTYKVSDGQGGTFEMRGARVSYFDLDKRSLDIVDAGLAYNIIYDANGKIAKDRSFLANDFEGFSRFCSSALFEAEQFGGGSGLKDRIYFTGEEDGGEFNPVGGGEWALDPETGSIWHAPAMGRGAWENVTEVDTGTSTHVAFILADDSSPFDFDDDGIDDPVPLYLYIGAKEPDATVPSGAPDFLAENGLRNGKLFVWVADSGVTRPSQFNTSGTQTGSWVEIDNAPTDDDSLKSETGEFGFDEFGYPTQGNLVLQAKEAGAFGFSRPEDVSTNPKDGTEFVLASTGVDTYDIDATGNGADTFGTMYTMKLDLSDLSAPRGDLTILYDGDADPARALRSPDNLDWADNGKIYVQEDEAEEQSLTGEPLFGPGAANPNEAGIVRINPNSGQLQRIANIDRDVVLDASIAVPANAVDTDAGDAGEWESSGLLDVSKLFGKGNGTLFLVDVQAHGIEDQDQFNANSRITDFDLREGGQLLILGRNGAITQGKKK